MLPLTAVCAASFGWLSADGVELVLHAPAVVVVGDVGYEVRGGDAPCGGHSGGRPGVVPGRGVLDGDRQFTSSV
jgi:hypothetical protein